MDIQILSKCKGRERGLRDSGKSLARSGLVSPGGVEWIASALIFLVTHPKNAKREGFCRLRSGYTWTEFGQTFDKRCDSNKEHINR
jgi:hypothetical protein